MEYLTFDEYEEMGGILTQSAFNLLEYEARKNIDNLTFGRLKELESQNDDVKNCMYKLINVVSENNGLLKSESVDGYSVSYADTKEQKQGLNDIVEAYLSECYLDDGTPYLYRGN